MNPERYQKVGDLYHGALELPPERRSAFLMSACGTDSELRREVESLLEAHHRAGEFIQTPALEVAAGWLTSQQERVGVGSRLGPYTILGTLGAGGMGEVYRATDTRLGRTVAIKILAPQGLGNPKAIQRFEREAHAASQLNHAHICTLYDVGHQDGLQFIVMEHLDGETLAKRLVRGPLPLDQVVRYAIEIAGALAHAHRQGIVHRDLKPANIMLTPAGAKLLDFGIAALRMPPLAGEESRDSDAPRPTETLTEPGSILGTIHYMAPEQLEARATDGRTDIFALGAMVYEMATGHQAFQGSSKASVIAAILTQDPERISLVRERRETAPIATAAARDTKPWLLDRIVARCLAKNPDDRWQTAADLEQALMWTIEAGSQSLHAEAKDRRQGWRLAAGWIAAGVLAIVAGLLGLKSLAPPPGGDPVRSRVQFEIAPPANLAFSPSAASFALSPDGKSLAFTGSSGQGDLAVWIHAFETTEDKRVSGTEGAGQIFWSPDGRSIAFADTSSNFTLKTIDVAGGLPQTIGTTRLGQVGAWTTDGATILHRGDAVIEQVAVASGAPRALTSLDASKGETNHMYPNVLPDGRHFIFVARSTQAQHDRVAYLASIDSTDRTALFNSDSQVVYAEPGYLLYMVGNTLLARGFDAKSQRVVGKPMSIAEQVERNTDSLRGAFTASQTGRLAYRRVGETELVWFDRGGRRLETLGPSGHYRNPALSPDGKRLALGQLDSKTGVWGVWIFDVDRGIESRLTLESSLDDMPVWSPDGAQVAYRSSHEGVRVFYRRATTGTGPRELVLGALPLTSTLHAWRPEGIVYSQFELPLRVGYDLWLLPTAAGAKPVQLIQTAFSETFCQPSPAGRWFAYASNDSGRFEIYLSTFPSGQGRWQVSAGGGTEPTWRADGKELFYLAPDRYVMAVRIDDGSSPQVGPPQRLFQAGVSSLVNPSYTRNQYVVAPDGERFLINQPAGKKALSAMTIEIDWPAALKNNSGF